MTERRWLLLIIALFLIVGTIYAVTTPPFEASDELWHYPMIRHLADGNPLPMQVFDPQLAGPWKQEASQPPLYYYAGAALTFWINTADMEAVRRENPHVDNGLITEDGNTNLVMHDPQANQWQGTLLALHLVRFMSLLMSAVTVYLTYRIASAAFAGRPEIALGAAAVNAFLPMFLFISGAVNNDNLAIMLASLALLLMISAVAGTDQHMRSSQAVKAWRRAGTWLLLGTVIGLAVLTKQGTIGLIPLAWGTCFLVAWLETTSPEVQSAMETLRGLLLTLLRSIGYFILVLLPVVLIAGWWYARNVQLYGDLLGWSAFFAVLGQRAHPASLMQLWGERRGFLMAYWGLFGGVNIPMPGWTYALFNTLLIISVIGFFLVLIQISRSWLHSTRGSWNSLQNVVSNVLRFIIDQFALVTPLLFSMAVVIGLIRWATTTWSSQGRLVFTAISALSTLFMIGLAGWLPQRAARWATGLVSLYFLLTSVAAPFLWITPAYDPSDYNLAQNADFEQVSVTLGETMRLDQAAVELAPDGNGRLQPGDSLWVHLVWEVLSPMDEDWSVFVHLVDPVLGRPVAQRDMYPGQGLLLTSWLEPGQLLTNSYLLSLPETAAAPAELELVAGLYNVQTGERLWDSSGSDVIKLGTLTLQPAPGELPNKVSINFEGELELAGYDIAPRSATPGEIIHLTLYWRALQSVDEDYTFFAQVVGEDTTRWASIDFMPPEVTSTWLPNEIHQVDLQLTVAEDTPAEVYPLVVGVYTRTDDGGFDRLQIQTPDGRLTDDFLELTQVRIE